VVAPLLGDYLEEGLSALGYSCKALERPACTTKTRLSAAISN
jgi:hypothetical protein